MEAIKGALDLSNSMQLQSISFPAISTGIYGFPKDRAARIILQTIHDWLKKITSTSLVKVRVVLINHEIFQIFQSEFTKLT
jgi:putative ATPase